MKKFIAFFSLVLLIGCSQFEESEKVLEPFQTITEFNGPFTPGIMEPESANGSVCTPVGPWKTIPFTNGFQGHWTDQTVTTSYQGLPVPLKDGAATFTIQNLHPTAPLHVIIYGAPQETAKVAAPNGGTVQWVWRIPDCTTNHAIVKRYVMTLIGGCNLNVLFWNSSWTNGHTVGNPSGFSVSTGGCPW